MSEVDIEMGTSASSSTVVVDDIVDKTPSIKKQKKKPLCSECHKNEVVKKPKRESHEKRPSKNFEKCRLNREFTRNYQKAQELYQKLVLEDFYSKDHVATSKYFLDEERSALMVKLEHLLLDGSAKYIQVKKNYNNRNNKGDEEKTRLVSLYEKDLEFLNDTLSSLDWSESHKEEVDEEEDEEEVASKAEEEEVDEDEDEEEVSATQMDAETNPPPTTPTAAATPEVVVDIEEPKSKKRKVKK